MNLPLLPACWLVLCFSEDEAIATFQFVAEVECEEATLQVEPPITRQPNDGERNRLKSNDSTKRRMDSEYAPEGQGRRQGGGARNSATLLDGKEGAVEWANRHTEALGILVAHTYVQR